MTSRTPAGSADLRLSVVPGLAQVSPAAWDRLLAADDAPLLSHGYLESLESSGCLAERGPESLGWQPAHLLLSRDGELCAAAPAYVKADSDGEWVYDLAWAEAAARRGFSYYPKLVLAVPFNPVGGRRLLVRPDLSAADREVLAAALLSGARRVAAMLRCSSVHALFPRAEELPVLERAGLHGRRQEQYHFINHGYRDFDDFLGHLRHNRRRTIRREREALREAGITVTTHSGLRGADGEPSSGFTLAQLDRVHELYEATSRRYTGDPPYLNQAHFRRCAERLGDRVELVLAHDREGHLLGGAFNLRGDTRLYGRHWGEAVHVPNLHFEVCLYHSMERCIAMGYRSFEPGHGGDQKLLRGFAPVYTYSAHGAVDPRLEPALAQYLALEAPYTEQALRAAQERCPLKEPPDPESPFARLPPS